MPCGVGASTSNEVRQNLFQTCLNVCNRLRGINTTKENENEINTGLNEIRADTDLRDNYSPGWKFNHWELKVK